MAPSNRASAFRLGDDILLAMERLQARDGISLSEQVRRALVPWLQRKGTLRKKSARKRASTTRRRA